MSHYKSIIRLALPIIIGQIGTIITGLVDTIMVGQYSTEELAASAFANNVFMFFMVIGIGFTFNFAPLVAYSLANNDKPGVGEWLKNSVAANTIIGLILFSLLIIVYFNIENLGQPKNLIPIIKPYFMVCSISLLPIMLYTSFRQFVESILEPSTAMWIFLVGNILNIIGNYILIYGKLGMPELGLYGAGLSTLFSRCMMLAMFIIILSLSKKYKEYKQGYLKGEWNFDLIFQLFRLGLPIGLQQGFEAASFCFVAIMVGWIDSLNLAAHQIVVSISSVCYMVYLGLGNAVAIKVSHFRGKNDIVNVKKVAYAGMALSLVVSSIISPALYSWNKEISMFFTDETLVAGLVRTAIPVIVIYVFADGIQITLANVLRGLADGKAIMYISALAYFFIAIPVGYFFGFTCDMKLHGVWIAFPFGFVVAAVLFFLRFKKLLQKSPNKLENKEIVI